MSEKNFTNADHSARSPVTAPYLSLHGLHNRSGGGRRGHTGFYKPTSLRPLSHFKAQPFLFGHFYWADRQTEGVSKGVYVVPDLKDQEQGEK